MLIHRLVSGRLSKNWQSHILQAASAKYQAQDIHKLDSRITGHPQAELQDTHKLDNKLDSRITGHPELQDTHKLDNAISIF